MTYHEFKESTKGKEPLVVLSPLLLALWHDAKGEWEKAHELAQDVHDKDGAWVHAYLHRKEGDLSNASYWYQQAGRSASNISLQKEWEVIVTDLLKK
jgi:hypothetical protein